MMCSTSFFAAARFWVSSTGREIIAPRLRTPFFRVEKLHISGFFRNFADRKEVIKTSRENKYIHHQKKTHKTMSKTVRTVLQILSYIIAAILGAAGEATMM